MWIKENSDLSVSGIHTMANTALCKVSFSTAIISCVCLLGCAKETWQGFYYPDGCLSCTEQYIFSPRFDAHDSCIAWATDLKAQRNNPSDDFECGKNCKAPDRLGGPYVCKETVDY